MFFHHRQSAAARAIQLLSLFLAAGMLADGIPESRAAECSLVRPIELIENAFRAGKPDPLTPLLPQEGKIFLALDSLGGGVGYFSRDQVYFILSGIFSRNETVEFGVRIQKPPSATVNKRRDDTGLSYCVGKWTFHRHDGARSENQIFFVLSMRKGIWSLVEIREAQ